MASASAAVLGFALVSQYGFGLRPCELCLYQRYPYAIVIIIGLAGFFLARRRCLQRAVLGLGLLAWLAGVGIAFYHAGVEKGVFTGPSACSGGGASADSLEELRAQIMNAPLVSCNQAMAEFLGLSMAAWNGITAIFLIIVTLLLWKRALKAA